jgi:prepilin-type N-terminal cleavage/methylation domain-containing protein
MPFSASKRGFTLLELICVLAMLATIMAVSAPSLAWFFKGRSLHEESRRFLALTRYARSEAVSASVPMELWIDTGSGNYGLRRQTIYGNEEENPLEYQLTEHQEFEVDLDDLDKEGIAIFIFLPDGTMHENNPEEITIMENGKESITIRKTESGVGYVIHEGDSNE